MLSRNALLNEFLVIHGNTLADVTGSLASLFTHALSDPLLRAELSARTVAHVTQSDEPNVNDALNRFASMLDNVINVYQTRQWNMPEIDEDTLVNAAGDLTVVASLIPVLSRSDFNQVYNLPPMRITHYDVHELLVAARELTPGKQRTDTTHLTGL